MSRFDMCGSSLRRGRAKLLRVPRTLMDDPRRGFLVSENSYVASAGVVARRLLQGFCCTACRQETKTSVCIILYIYIYVYTYIRKYVYIYIYIYIYISSSRPLLLTALTVS